MRHHHAGLSHGVLLLWATSISLVFTAGYGQETPVAILEAQGLAHLGAGRFDEALKAFREARAAAEKAGDVPTQVRLRQHESRALHNAAPGPESPLFDQAIEVLQGALKLAQQIRDAMLEDGVLADLSMLQNTRGAYESALEYAERAVALHQRAGNKPMAEARQRMVDTLRIVLLKDAGKLEEALSLQEKQLQAAQAALEAAQKATPKKPEGVTDEVWAQIRNAQVGGPRIVALSTLATVTVTLTELGRFGEAVTRAREGIALAKAAGDASSLATALSSLSWVYLRTGAFERALQAAKDMQQILEGQAEAKQDLVARVTVASYLPWIYAAFGDYETALQWMEKWAQLADADAQTKSQAVLPLVKSVEYLQCLDRAREAVPLADKALAAAEEAVAAGNKWLYVPQALIARGGLRVELGQTEEGLSDLQRARAELEKSPLRGRQFLLQECQAKLAEAHLKAGRAKEALDAVEAFAQVLRNPVAQGVHWRAHYLRGRARELGGELEAAKESYLAAVGLIESQRVRITSTEMKTSFFADKAQVYRALVRVLMKLKDLRGALDALERGRSRALLALLQRGQVRVTTGMTQEEIAREGRLQSEVDRLSDALVAESYQSPTGSPRATKLTSALQTARTDLVAFQDKLYQRLPDLQARRGEGRAFQSDRLAPLLKAHPEMVVLEYLLGDPESFLFVLGGAGEKPVLALDLPVTAQAVGARVKRLRKACLKGQELDSYLKYSEELRTTLIDPAREALAGRKLIVVIPDGELTDLPFHALTASQAPAVGKAKGPRYLLEDYAFAYAPSLGVLEQVMNRARPAAADQRSLIAFGNPDFGQGEQVATASRGTLSPLPGTQEEVARLSKLYGSKATVYTSQQATEAQAKKEAPLGERVHFATHGLLDHDNPFNSAVAFSQTGGGDDDGFLEAREIAAMKWNCNLAVLSACETARGKPTAGEGVLGLSWSLFAAGVPTTIAGLWKVSDISTMQLMSKFHEQLTAGIGKAEALRAAELSLLHSEEFSPPFYWAPFILIGSPD